MLATAGKFITKTLKIAQKEINNLIADSISLPITQFNSIQKFGASLGRSYYFEYSGKGTCEIKINNVLKEVVTLDSKGYSKVTGLLDNSDAHSVEMTFKTDFPMVVKNVAIYADNFETKEDVPAYTNKVQYNLKELAPDFYQIDPQGIYYDGAYQKYLQTNDFYQEGTTTLVLDKDMIGNFTIYYRAYPVQITKDTDDEYEMPIDNEVFTLLPLYMASELYKDDDNGIATSYRNEFEIGFERLKNSANLSAYEEFTSESGWI